MSSQVNNKNKRTDKENILNLLQIACFLVLAGLAYLFYLLGAAASTIYFVSVFIAGVITVAVWWGRRSRKTMVLIVIYLAIAIGWPILGQSPLDKYQRFYRHVSQGMSNKEILSLFEGYFPEYTKNGKPTIRIYDDGFSFTLDPGSSSYNAENISIKMQDNHVVKKNYYPD